jgi:hypothetical protein
MKILNLTSEIKEALSAQAKKVSAARNAILKTNSKLAKAEQRQIELIDEIAALEKSDPDDEKAVRTLGEKRTALSLANHQIAELPQVDAETEHRLKHLVMETARLIESALVPTEEHYISEIAELLKPFCIDDANAKWLARQTAAAMSLAGRVHIRYGTYGAVVPAARLAVESIEEILTGELNWSFTPKS